MTDNEFSIYDLLDKMRARPVLYTGVVSLSLLNAFVQGYRHALLERGFQEVSEPSLMDFGFWARARLGQDQMSIGWSGSILEACGGDEKQAFEHFYGMLDEYRSNQFPGLVERWDAEWDAIYDARLEAEWAAEAEQEDKGE